MYSLLRCSTQAPSMEEIEENLAGNLWCVPWSGLQDKNCALSARPVPFLSLVFRTRTAPCLPGQCRFRPGSNAPSMPETEDLAGNLWCVPQSNRVRIRARTAPCRPSCCHCRPELHTVVPKAWRRLMRIWPAPCGCLVCLDGAGMDESAASALS